VSWIKSRWQAATLLTLVVAAIAVPAWASSDGSGEVERAAEPSDPDTGQVEPAPAPSGASDEVALPSPITREQLDQALQCMADHGYGMGTATDDGGPDEGGALLIPRAETETDEFQQAAKECELPPPPTDAQIRQLGCADDQARREGNE